MQNGANVDDLWARYLDASSEEESISALEALLHSKGASAPGVTLFEYVAALCRVNVRRYGRQALDVDPEGIALDVIVEMISNRKKIRHLRGWLQRTARFRVVDQVRRLSRLPVESSESLVARDAVDYSKWIAEESGTVTEIESSAAEDIAEDRGELASLLPGGVELQDLTSAILKLSERDRAILEMIYSDGLPQREVAQVMGISYANVRQLHHRALKQLREHLKLTVK